MRQLLSLFVVAGCTLATPLTAQRALSFGFASTIGSGWQIESGELSYIWRHRSGPIGAFSAGARLGTFIDEGAIIGGTRGIVVAPTLAARSRAASLAELGDEQNPMSITVDVTLEATGYLASSSPLPIGSRWAAVALLPGIRAGSGDGMRYGLVIGPTAFFGSGPSTVRGLLALRIETPLARRERRP